MVHPHGLRTLPEKRPFACAVDEMDMHARWLNIAGKTSNPEGALQNLLVRDALFTDHVRKGEGRPSCDRGRRLDE